jgi:N-acyl-D-amino-acid deacylase
MAVFPQHADVLITGGMVVDGSDRPPRPADVAVVADRILAVGKLPTWTGERVLEAGGLVVAPGFIDMHTHSDLSLLIDPRAESKIRQGVTTEVIGQCGSSPAPCPRERTERIRASFGSWGQAADWRWGSFGEYLAVLRERKPSVNVAPMVGHGMLRVVAMGEEGRAPTESELEEMRRLARTAMEEGAFGMSTGLVYAPGVFATTEEIVALAQAIAPMNGLYFSHIRGESDGLLGAIEEAVRIGREAGVSVEIAHLKADGRANWGRTEAALAAIVQAREEGVQVSYDCYPYTAWNTGLGQLVPVWAREGGTEAMLARLADGDTRAKIRSMLETSAQADPGRWERRMVSSVDSEQNRALQGMTLAEIAAQRKQPAEEVVIGLLLEEKGRVGMVGFGMCEEDVQRVVAHPVGMIGSDAAAVGPQGLLGQGHPHPRTYGTFVRVLGRYVREAKALSLEAAVAKMTSRPAQKLGLQDRGLIAPGMAADICVFDPAAIADRATYQQPQQFPAGVHYVLVNGVIEVEGQEHHGRGAGRVLAPR